MFHFTQKEIKDTSKPLAPSLKTGTTENENDNSLICIHFFLESALIYIVPSCRYYVNNVESYVNNVYFPEREEDTGNEN